MNRDPKDYGNDNDKCGNQQVANHFEPPIRLLLSPPSTRWNLNKFVERISGLPETLLAG